MNIPILFPRLYPSRHLSLVVSLFNGHTSRLVVARLITICNSYVLPAARLNRHAMSDKDLDDFRDKVPGLKKGSSQLFRSLRDKGIISYTEYLFLLSVLTSE